MGGFCAEGRSRLPLLEVDVGVGVALAGFFLAEVGSSVVVSLRFAFPQNQGKGKALVFSCAGRGKSWVEKGEETTVGGAAASTGNKGPLCGFWFWEPKIPMAGWRPEMKEML